jgi:hypothetical protein
MSPKITVAHSVRCVVGIMQLTTQPGAFNSKSLFRYKSLVMSQ